MDPPSGRSSPVSRDARYVARPLHAADGRRSFTRGGEMANRDEKGRGHGGGTPREIDDEPVAGGNGELDDEEGLEVSPLDLVAALARLDLEAALAYEAAAPLTGDMEMMRQLTAFAKDHRRHVAGLNRVLEAYGQPSVAPESGPGIPLLAGIVQLAGPLGPDVIVVALLGNEQLTNLSYDGALAYQWDDQIEAMLQEFQADEERHLAWLAEQHEAIVRHAPESEQPSPLS
jgi:rubrerythrin